MHGLNEVAQSGVIDHDQIAIVTLQTTYDPSPGLGSIPELELELIPIPIPIPGIGIAKELNKRNWNWNWN